MTKRIFVIVALLTGMLLGAWADRAALAGTEPNQRVVAHHCLAEDDWGYVGLRDYSAAKVVLRCAGH